MPARSDHDLLFASLTDPNYGGCHEQYASEQWCLGRPDGAAPVPLRFEVAILPVSDVDRAKAFYQAWDAAGRDISVDETFRVVQLPTGSPASIQFGVGMTSRQPGSADGLYLVVDDIDAAGPI